MSPLSGQFSLPDNIVGDQGEAGRPGARGASWPVYTCDPARPLVLWSLPTVHNIVSSQVSSEQ